MKFPILPAALSVGIGAGDGFLANVDVNEGKGVSPPLTKSKATYLQAGSIAFGVLGEFMNWHPDITETFMFTGAALLSRSVAFKLAQQGQTSPVPAQGFMQAIPASRPALGVGGGSEVGAGFNYRQPAGSVA